MGMASSIRMNFLKGGARDLVQQIPMVMITLPLLLKHLGKLSLITMHLLMILLIYLEIQG